MDENPDDWSSGDIDMILRRIVHFVILSVCFVFPVQSKILLDEAEKNVDKEKLWEQKSFVQTSGFGGLQYFYFFDGDSRLWKSPPASLYFLVSGGTTLKDLNGDGVKDFLITGGEPKFFCGNYGLVIWFGGSDTPYLVHYDSAANATKYPNGLLEMSEQPDEKYIEAMMNEAMELACPGDKERVRDLFVENKLEIIKDPKLFRDEVTNRHKSAMTAYSEKKLKKAIDELDSIFFKFDYRGLDSDLVDQKYTEMLNDYGFFLQQYAIKNSYRLNDAIAILSYVVARDPARTVAYLNLADAEFQDTESDTKAARKTLSKAHYIKYHELMIAAGKKDKIPARVFVRMK